MFSKLKYSYNTVILYFTLGLCMLFLNFITNYATPFSLALYIAILFCGLPAIESSILYLLAGITALFIAPVGYIVYCIQALILGGLFYTLQYYKKEIRLLIIPTTFLAIAPFFWIYGQFVLHNFTISSILSALLFVETFLFLAAMHFIFGKLNKSKPSIEDLIFTACSFLFVGVGMIKTLSSTVYLSFSLFALLVACFLSKNGNAIFTALTLALPLTILYSVQKNTLFLQEIAFFVLYTLVILICMRFNKILTSCLLFTVATAVYFITESMERHSFLALWKTPHTYWTLIAILIPSLLYTMAPDSLLKHFRKKWRQFHERPLVRASINHNRAQVGERLFEISAAFREIECSFLGLEGYENNIYSMQAVMLEQLKAECCTSCEKANDCEMRWREANLQQLIHTGCNNGKVGMIDVPNTLNNFCFNSTALLFSLNKMLTEYKKQTQELENEKRAKQLIMHYAKNVSNVLKELAIEQSAPIGSEPQREKQLQQYLAKNGIICTDILLHKNPVELLLTLEQNIDNKKLLQLLEEKLNFPLTLVDKQYINTNLLCYRFKKRPKFDALFGIASAVKSGESVSGDTHSITRINEKTFLCALADGMGSGIHAREVSDLTLNLIESFYRAGMQSDTILSTVNGLLNTGHEESFACIDMATINLENGRADIIKIGSPLAFLLGQEQIEMLCSQSLPLGILDGIHPTILVREMRSGDILLFLSDGVTSAFGSSTDIASYLSTLSPSNPQHLVDSIVGQALQFTNGVATDDITAVAIRLFEQKVA